MLTRAARPTGTRLRTARPPHAQPRHGAAPLAAQQLSAAALPADGCSAVRPAIASEQGPRYRAPHAPRVQGCLRRRRRRGRGRRPRPRGGRGGFALRKRTANDHSHEASASTTPVAPVVEPSSPAANRHASDRPARATAGLDDPHPAARAEGRSTPLASWSRRAASSPRAGRAPGRSPAFGMRSRPLGRSVLDPPARRLTMKRGAEVPVPDPRPPEPPPVPQPDPAPMPDPVPPQPARRAG
jgi:hypothetical protein